MTNVTNTKLWRSLSAPARSDGSACRCVVTCIEGLVPGCHLRGYGVHCPLTDLQGVICDLTNTQGAML